MEIKIHILKNKKYNVFLRLEPKFKQMKYIYVNVKLQQSTNESRDLVVLTFNFYILIFEINKDQKYFFKD